MLCATHLSRIRTAWGMLAMAALATTRSAAEEAAEEAAGPIGCPLKLTPDEKLQKQAYAKRREEAEELSRKIFVRSVLGTVGPLGPKPAEAALAEDIPSGIG